VLARLVEFDEAVDHAAGSDEVVLWFEHDLHCQLMLARVLDRLSRGMPRSVSLVGPGYFLDEGDMRALFDARPAVTPAMTSVARAAWAAFTSAEPLALAALAAEGTPALPHLAPALRRHLEQFPSIANGLARTESAIVAALADGPRSRLALFESAQATEETPYLGDTIFWDHLEGLARAPAPLALMDGDSGRLTPHGREVHGGVRDAIDLRGVDRWLGGVHLLSEPAPRRAAIWRWSTAARTVVKG
jgi:hypothetical protein